MAIDLNNLNLRRCRLCLWNNYAGLGFILEPAPLPPHIVQLVESNSPAAAAGLRIRDVILAVNHKNMCESSYDDLKYTIKKARGHDGHIELLVIDQDIYELFKEKNQSIDPRLAKTIETPSTMPIDYQNFPKHQPRTCEIHLNRHDTSFGFQTVNPLTDVGILIQEVYPNSPAAKTSLRKCDRIIEIDDEFIDEIPSRTILEKLRTAKEKRYVKLYVVDTATYDFFQLNNIPLSSKEYRQSTFARRCSTDSRIGEDKIASPLSSYKFGTMSASFKRGLIEVEIGDITRQNVDVIIVSSSSRILRTAIIKAAGNETQAAYDLESKNHPNFVLIATPSGALPCKQIFFVKWKPDDNEEILQQSLVDLIHIVVQNVKSYQFTSIAFPAIGCGKHECSIDIVVKTMVLEIKKNLIKRNLPWTVKFVVEPDKENIYNEFCKQILTTQDGLHEPKIYQLPSTWEKSKEQKIRFRLSTRTNEYASLASNFDQAMKENYTQIIKIERIQNERWYMQYLAHKEDFEKRLNMDTETSLYHGCSEQAAHSISEDCFNRSFAGAHETIYGVGVYFSSKAAYSHKYTETNANGERCMFIARVLIGKTTKGNSSMKTRPLGFDSTTDGNHIFVIYHDAQAYAEYLITYK
ncbi:unnamed protein product [Rotaria sp. Silwood1]|nr:unnamed protein product [Rotaria sp. Silwood1]CAF4937747.1 unnamed protein product [Rotaria sp. Silwood1]